MENCPKCNHTKIIKNGFACGQQRYKCKVCNYQFTQTSLELGGSVLNLWKRV